jgi:hypothetical protein
MTIENDHIWFEEQIAAYLSRGLEGEDLARFEAHREACASCAAKLQAAAGADEQLHHLFKDVAPSSSFEDRLIQRLRTDEHRQRIFKFPTIHPAIRKAAVAVAAVIVLGGFGYVATEQMGHGRIPVLWADARATKTASDLRHIGAAAQLYANENKGAYPRTRMLADDADGDGAAYGRLYGGWKTNRSPVPYGVGAGGDAKLGPADRFASPVRDTRKQMAGSSAGANDFTNGNVTNGKTFGGEVSSDTSESGGSDPNAAKKQSEAAADKSANRDGQNFAYGDGHGGFAQNPIAHADVNYFKPTAGVAPSAESAEKDREKQNEVALQLNAPAQNQGQQAQQKRENQPFRPGAVALGTTAAPAPLATPAAPEQAPPPETTPPAAPPTSAPSDRRVIRNGTLEFEIDSFDNAVVTVSKIVREEGGFVSTTTSEKLPNGKVKGTIALRVPPDHLDTLVLKLRGLGDLKRQNLTADDVTKQYNDLQSELRAAQAMQERLIDLIKNGKGAIKDLLAAEKELGTWREKIEQVQGEINYYNNLVAMATLNLSLYERDIRQAAEVKQTEDVQMGVEAEDVETARTSALKAIEDAKGRVVESELKKFEAGQFAAKIVADVSPDQAGSVIDRLKQLGKVARLEIERKQTAPSDVVVKDGLKVERGDTRLNISLYNLANVAPRQTVNLTLASDEVEKSYNTILARIEKANGRVVSSNLNRAKPDQTTGTIQFETKSADAEAVLQDVRMQGEAMKMTVVENTETANLTTTKRGFSVQIVSTAVAAAREAETMSIAAPDVPTSYRAILDAAHTLNLRVTESQMNQVDPQNVSATMTVELKRDQQAEFEKALAAQGQILNRTVQRSTDNENTLDTKLRWQIALMDADRIAPRQTTGVTIETSDVEQGLNQITAAVEAASGRVADSGVSKETSGQSTARARIEIPLAKAGAVIDAIRGQGKVREIQSSKNMQAPDGALARASIDLTLTSGEQIVGADHGLWATIRNGLATSVSGLLWSLQLIIIGLCLVAPWVLLLWAGWKIVRRRKQTTPAPA